MDYAGAPPAENTSSNVELGQPGVTYVPDPQGTGMYVCWGPRVSGENPLQFEGPPQLPPPTLFDSTPGLLSILYDKGLVQPIQSLEPGTTTTIMTTKSDSGLRSEEYGVHGVIYIPIEPQIIERFNQLPEDIKPRIVRTNQYVPGYPDPDLSVIMKYDQRQQPQQQQQDTPEPPDFVTGTENGGPGHQNQIEEDEVQIIEDVPQRPVIWTGWRLQFYFTYPTLPFNVGNQNVEFYIHGAAEDISTQHVGFVPIVTSPSGANVEVIIKLDLKMRCRYVCHFYAGSPGVYRTSVQFNHHGHLHLHGSPFNITVTRDYMNLQNATRVVAKISEMFQKSRTKLCGLCADENHGRIYLADKHTHQIHILGFDGRHILSFGTMGRQPGQFFRPCGLALDGTNDRLIVADKNNNRICIYTSAGDYIGSFGRAGRKSGEFCLPWGVAVSQDGTMIAVADTQNHRVQLFNKNGDFLREYNHYEHRNTELTPCSISFNRTGTMLYVTDYYNETVSAMSVDFKEKFVLCPYGNLSKPSGVAVDPAGNILICDSKRDCVRVLTTNGYLMATICGTEETFVEPVEITVLRNGNVIVLDFNGVVHVY